MSKVLDLKVTYCDCENKIWRQFKILESMRMVDFGYLIIASFDSCEDKLFSFLKDNMEYQMFDESYLDTGVMFKEEVSILNLKKGDKFDFIYDYNCVEAFEIEVLDEEEIGGEAVEEELFPRVVFGEGKGIIDGLSAKELLSCIREIDKTGKSEKANENYYAKSWNYKEYDLSYDDEVASEQIEYLKEVYECFDPSFA